MHCRKTPKLNLRTIFSCLFNLKCKLNINDHRKTLCFSIAAIKISTVYRYLLQAIALGRLKFYEVMQLFSLPGLFARNTNGKWLNMKMSVEIRFVFKC